MFNRGDRVLVEGYGGRTAVLRVWDDLGKGVALCSEESYPRALAGEDVAVVGYPLHDVKEVISEQREGED